MQLLTQAAVVVLRVVLERLLQVMADQELLLLGMQTKGK
jgi:hypothetical protein